MILPAVLLAILLPAAVALAQDDGSFAPEPEIAAEPAPDPAPLTLRENYSYTANQIFGTPELLRMAGRAVIDHLENDPKGWGTCARRLCVAIRLTSRCGRGPGKHCLWYPRPGRRRSQVRAIRQRPSLETGRLCGGAYLPGTQGQRQSYAGVELIDRELRDTLYRPAVAPDGTMGGRELRTGSIGAGLSVTQNLYLEFWPDVKKKFHR